MEWTLVIAAGLAATFFQFRQTITIAFEEKGLVAALGVWSGLALIPTLIIGGVFFLTIKVLG